MKKPRPTPPPINLTDAPRIATIDDVIQNYLRDLAIGQSPRTVETYAQGLERFKEYLTFAKHSPTDIASTLSVDHALECARWLNEERDIAKATLRTYLATLSQFYAYLLREKIVELPASDIERMRGAFKKYRRGYSRPLPKLPPDEAITAILRAARAMPKEDKKPRLELARLRNIAMLEALRASGMRVGELVTLKRDDLDYRTHAARVIGKGDKQRIVYFDDAAWNAIQNYLKARSDGAKGRALYELPLFARHDRRASERVLPLTTDSVRLVFNALARAAGIDITMTPHSLRHAFATKVLDTTGDLAIVQDMLGHSSPETTRIYAKVSNKKMRAAHRAAFGYRGDADDKGD
ncbi:MAG: tyrosine-type recombinase/integrase [Chloroflexi bacterium]|nr:tyrosine-type recombinase/integrase [Chloroflexota bacterium]